MDLFFWIEILIGLYVAHLVVAKIFKKKPNFASKVVLITGASSGIGEELAYQFSRLGAYIILSARREEELKRVQKSLAIPEKSQIFVMNLDSPSSQVMKQTSAFVSKIGRVDIAILNAGLSQREQFIHMDLDVMERLMRVNYFSVMAMVKAVLPQMIAQKSGQIVVTSSIAGLMGPAMRTGYSASKHAVHGFLSALRGEVAHHGISVSIISPGYIQTNISRNAVRGDGQSFGKLDTNIKKGMNVEEAGRQFIDAVYRKKPEFIISSLYYKVVAKLVRMSGRLAAIAGRINYKQQMNAVKKAE